MPVVDHDQRVDWELVLSGTLEAYVASVEEVFVDVGVKIVHINDEHGRLKLIKVRPLYEIPQARPDAASWVTALEYLDRSPGRSSLVAGLLWWSCSHVEFLLLDIQSQRSEQWAVFVLQCAKRLEGSVKDYAIRSVVTRLE